MSAVDLAFVIRVRNNARHQTPWRPLDSTPSVHAAGFEVAHHLTWVSSDDTVHLDAWVGQGAAEVARDSPTTNGIAMLCGHRLSTAGTFEFGGRTADTPASASEARHGAYASFALKPHGDGVVWNDPLGFRCLYVANEGDRSVIGSRAALVAAARGVPVTRDLQHAAWLGWLARWVGDATGFAGVRTLDPGSSVRIDNGTCAVVHRPLPWATADELHGRSVTQLADIAIEDVTASLLAASKSPTRPILRLTGGRDSRVLLALAIAAGVAEDFDYLTVGPPHLPDVLVATELCERFGLRHQVEFLGLNSDVPYSERATDFARATCGMVSIFDTRPPRPPDDRLTVTGVCGELLRASTPIKRPMIEHADVLTHYRADRYNQDGLVKADVFDQLHAELRASLGDAHSLAPLDVVQRHAVTTSMRFVRMGPSLELPTQRTVQPLNSVRAAQAAHALGGEQRQGEVLVAEMIRRTAPEVLNVRFAGPPWGDLAVEHLGTMGHEVTVEAPPEPTSATASATEPTVTPGEKTTLMQQLSRSGGSRVDFLHEVASDGSSPAWDVIDRGAMTDALSRFDDLSGNDRRNVFGAATAVLWLSE